jgi:hypothetical protein
MPDWRDVAGWSRHLVTRSAVNPALWLTAFVTPLGLYLSQHSLAPFSFMYFVLASLPVFLVIWQVVKFTNRDPDRLQTEQHLENKMLYSRIGDNLRGREVELIVDKRSQLINNPAMEQRNE